MSFPERGKTFLWRHLSRTWPIVVFTLKFTDIFQWWYPRTFWLPGINGRLPPAPFRAYLAPMLGPSAYNVTLFYADAICYDAGCWGRVPRRRDKVQVCKSRVHSLVAEEDLFHVPCRVHPRGSCRHHHHHHRHHQQQQLQQQQEQHNNSCIDMLLIFW